VPQATILLAAQTNLDRFGGLSNLCALGWGVGSDSTNRDLRMISAYLIGRID
jgi:hypothetical protein